MENRAREICLKALNENRSKKVVFKDRFKEEMLTRPFSKKGNPYVLSYEIYSDPSKLKEREAVNALNELVEEEVAEIKFTKGYVWYAKKGKK